MALFVYNTQTGELASYSQGDNDPVADNATLAAAGLSLVRGLPQLDDTHDWDPATKTVVTKPAAKSYPSVKDFWKRFTPAEREAIENLYATGTQTQKNKIAAFLRYLQAEGRVDINDNYVQSAVQLMETAGVIGAGRAAQVLV